MKNGGDGPRAWWGKGGEGLDLEDAGNWGRMGADQRRGKELKRGDCGGREMGLGDLRVGGIKLGKLGGDVGYGGSCGWVEQGLGVLGREYKVKSLLERAPLGGSQRFSGGHTWSPVAHRWGRGQPDRYRSRAREGARRGQNPAPRRGHGPAPPA